MSLHLRYQRLAAEAWSYGDEHSARIYQRQAAEALLNEPDGSLEDLDLPTPQERKLPVAPTVQQKLAARVSRLEESIAYARRGQPLKFGSAYATPVECDIAVGMVRRSPGLQFKTALALLRT